MNSYQEKYSAQIEELAATARRLGELGYVTSHGGNLSCRVDENVVVITPTKVAKRKIQFEDVCVIDLDGNVLYAAPNRKPTGEWPFHTRIFQKRSDIKGIVHAHPPVLTGFAIAGGDWMEKAFLPEPVIEVGPMIMVPYAEPLSDELAEMFDSVIERSNGFLMENHGALMCSPEGVERALEFLEMMEAAGISIMVAQALGNPKTIPASDVLRLDNVIRIRNMPFPGLKGKVTSVGDIYKL